MPGTSFPPESRLRQSRDFRAVFKKGARYVRPGLVLIAAPGRYNRPRLGLAIAKKRLPRAVDRNRVKRVIRESFRRRQTELGATDVVVLARNGTAGMSNRRLSGQLYSAWAEIAQAARHGSEANRSGTNQSTG